MTKRKQCWFCLVLINSFLFNLLCVKSCFSTLAVILLSIFFLSVSFHFVHFFSFFFPCRLQPVVLYSTCLQNEVVCCCRGWGRWGLVGVRGGRGGGGRGWLLFFKVILY